MKTKTFSKKLQFNKTTIANLGENAMDKVKGGSLPGSHCATYCYPLSCEDTCRCLITLDGC